jgi:hypothetical protein
MSAAYLGGRLTHAVAGQVDRLVRRQFGARPQNAPKKLAA